MENSGDGAGEGLIGICVWRQSSQASIIGGLGDCCVEAEGNGRDAAAYSMNTTNIDTGLKYRAALRQPITV